MAQLVEQSLPILQVSGSNPVKILQLTYLLFNCWKKTGSPGLVVMGRDSCSEGREFKSQHIKLDGLFPQLFVVRIVMFVWRGEDKWKRWRVGPLIKLAFWSRLRALKRNFPTDQMLCSNVGIYWSIQKVEDDNVLPIDTVSNLVFWSCQVNKLEPWHIVYIMQQ